MCCAVWTSFAAAALTDATTRQQMFSQLWKFASSNTTTKPFPSMYKISDGSQVDGTARYRVLTCRRNGTIDRLFLQPRFGCIICSIGTKVSLGDSFRSSYAERSIQSLAVTT